MLDVYFSNMDGVEVHAETPEEEQEAAFILNSALSGKTTFLGGCLCPSEADSTVSKGFRLMLSEGTAGCGRYTRAGNLLHYSE